MRERKRERGREREKERERERESERERICQKREAAPLRGLLLLYTVRKCAVGT